MSSRLNGTLVNYEEKFIVYEWSCCHASQLMRPGHH